MSSQNSDTTRSQTAVWASVDAYFTDALIQQDAALASARDSGARTTMPQAEVASNQGALLSLLTQMVGARRVLEFGTFAGYSTIWLARGVGGGGKVVTLELDEQNATVARKNLSRAGLADRVEILVGEAATSAQRLIGQRVAPFDVVFIDADKANNPVYLASALKLTKPSAIILIDNVVRGGGVLDAESTDASVQGFEPSSRTSPPTLSSRPPPFRRSVAKAGTGSSSCGGANLRIRPRLNSPTRH